MWRPSPRRTAVLLLALLVLAPSAGCGGEDGPTLDVFAAASLTDVFEEIGARWEAAHGEAQVRFSFGGSQRLRLQLEQGARADLFASADRAQMERAGAAGLIGEATVFAANGLALVAPADNPAGLESLADVGASGVRLVVAAPEVPAGALTRAVLESLGVADAVLAGVVSEEESVRRVLAKVELGEADAGFVYSTDALAAAARVLRLPLEETGMRNTYLIALTAEADEPALAADFLTFLLGAEAQSILAAAGFTVLPEAGP